MDGSSCSWLEFNVPFQHKYGYIRDERSGLESYPYPVKEGQLYINVNPGCLLFSSYPIRERDREVDLNYASTYNKGDKYHTARLKLNQIREKWHP